MKESNIIKLLQLSVSKLTQSVLFRNNTGMGWTGDSKHINGTADVLVRMARPLHAGLTKGSSDLIGWTTVEITSDMVGKNVAIFTAIEGKSASGKASAEQLNFIKQVRQSGGIAGIAKDGSEAVNIIKNSWAQGL